jgi:hypothetical protein
MISGRETCPGNLGNVSEDLHSRGIPQAMEPLQNMCEKSRNIVYD